MTIFLTSNPFLEGSLNPANDFLARLGAALDTPCPTLYICSDPDDFARCDAYAQTARDWFAAAGFPLSPFACLDRRNQDRAAALVRGAKLLILAGGHVPTQNRFFHEIGLRELLQDWDGVLVGISAGSMNAAELVYAQPEEPGEAIDPDYARFLPGLGLTRTQILPHFRDLRDAEVDGLRVVEDISLPDSLGRCFYAISDGDYLLCQDGRETFYGETWRIRDGALEPLCGEGETCVL